MDHTILPEETNVRRMETKVLMHHRVVKTLSIIIIILGVISFGVGVASLAISLIVKCQFHPDDPYNYHRYDRYGYTMSMVTTTPYSRMCSYYRTFASPGLWCGIMYIVTGVIGIFASRRRTICFVVTLMALTVVSNWVSLSGMVLSMGSHFDKQYYQLNDYPLSLHVLSSLVTLTSLIVFIIQWIEFGYTCHAACCNGRKGYPEMKKRRNPYAYRPLEQSQPVAMHHAPTMQLPPAATHPGLATSYSVPLHMPQPGPDTVFLVRNQQVIGVLPQNLLGQQIFSDSVTLQS